MKRAVVVLLSVLALAGCAGTQPEPEPPRVGFSVCSLLVERWYKDLDQVTDKLEEYGAQVLVRNANNDYDLQYDQVADLLGQGIDVLILIATDSRRCGEIVEMAQKQGVKVISYERLIIDAPVDAHYSFDNVAVGQLMGRILASRTRGNFLLINGDPADSNSDIYRDGYMQVLGPYLDNGSIQVLGEYWAVNWKQELAYDAVEWAVSQDAPLHGVIAENDSLAGMAIEALAEVGLAQEVLVVGQDGDLAACQRIAKGTQLATIYKPYDQLAGAVAQAAVRLARGEPLELEETVDNGAGQVPYYSIAPVLITGDNMLVEIVDKGIYSLSEIGLHL